MHLNCPFCFNQSKIDDVVIMNCEAYGSKQYKLACSICKGPVFVYLRRTVVVEGTMAGSFAEDDWGQKTVPVKELRRKSLLSACAARHNAKIADQETWIRECGGDLAGYIANYGSKDDPDHYGDGGEAIYAADMAELERLKE